MPTMASKTPSQLDIKTDQSLKEVNAEDTHIPSDGVSRRLRDTMLVLLPYTRIYKGLAKTTDPVNGCQHVQHNTLATTPCDGVERAS